MKTQWWYNYRGNGYGPFASEGQAIAACRAKERIAVDKALAEDTAQMLSLSTDRIKLEDQV